MRLFYKKETGDILDFVSDDASPTQDTLSEYVCFGASELADGTETNISELIDFSQLIEDRVINGQKITSDYVNVLRNGTLEEKVNAIVNVLLGEQ